MKADKIDGYYKEYYRSGQLKVETDYTDGKKHGRGFEYFEDSAKKFTGFYKNGEIDSVCRWYYPSGQIKESSYWKEGRRAAEWVLFYPDGGISAYNFVNFSGQLVYWRNYDESGNNVKEGGNPIGSIVISPKNALLKIGESAIFDIYVARPPQTHIDIYCIGNNGKRYEDSTLKNTDLDYMYRFEKQFATEGEYQWQLALMLTDLKSDSIETVLSESITIVVSHDSK